MGFFDALLGRSKPKRANLDDLFALPPAALTLQAATGFTPTGVGAVAFRQVEGGRVPVRRVRKRRAHRLRPGRLSEAGE